MGTKDEAAACYRILLVLLKKCGVKAPEDAEFGTQHFVYWQFYRTFTQHYNGHRVQPWYHKNKMKNGIDLLYFKTGSSFQITYCYLGGDS